MYIYIHTYITIYNMNIYWSNSLTKLLKQKGMNAVQWRETIGFGGPPCFSQSLKPYPVRCCPTTMTKRLHPGGSPPPTCPAVACRSRPSPTGRCCSWVFGRHRRAPASSLQIGPGRPCSVALQIQFSSISTSTWYILQCCATLVDPYG